MCHLFLMSSRVSNLHKIDSRFVVDSPFIKEDLTSILLFKTKFFAFILYFVKVADA